jgi:PmbA protein
MAQGAHSLQACQAESALQHVWFANSAGVACEDCQKYAVLFVEPVAKIDDYVDSNYAFAAGTELGPLDIGDVAKRAVERAMQYRGAKQVKGGSMPVVIKADAMADIVGAFAPMFSADSAQKGLSLLKGKEGTAIANEFVTLVDSPDHPQLGFGYAFDGEGVPTTKKNVIDHGVLTTLLYDVASANRQGVESTGNARRSYSSTVSISPFHFYVEPGEAAFDDLLREAKDGIIVAEVSGLHAGVNPTSGDFSLLAKGFALSGGEQGAPIDQMVLSGNFHAMLKGVRLISNDLTFGLPGGSCFGSPSVLVDNLVVASD